MATGNIRTWLYNLKPVKRYTLYIVPLALVLAVPICVSFSRSERFDDNLPAYTIAGTDEKRFWILIECVWLGLWICRAIAFLLPRTAKCFIWERRPGKTDYEQLLARLGGPISLLLWMALTLLAVVLVSSKT